MICIINNDGYLYPIIYLLKICQKKKTYSKYSPNAICIILLLINNERYIALEKLIRRMHRVNANFKTKRDP